MINRKTSLLSLVFLFFLFTSISSASVTKKKILILYSLQPRMPAFEVLDQNFRNLQLNQDTQVEYFTEYLEQARFRDEKSVKKQADLINHKYKINKPDIVIAVMSPALNFIQKYCKTTFENTPIVYALIDKKVDPKNMEIKATGVNLHIDLQKTLKAALSIQPETRDVYVVVGTSALGGSWEAQAKEKFQQFSPQINFHYLSNLSMDDILHKVSKLPPQAIVLYLLIIKDASGKSFVPRDALNTISRSSSVPVYGLWSTYVGHGIIGGRLCSSDLLGKNVNKMVIRILNGESLDKVPPISLGPSIYMFDWRQMKRFGIDEKRIPDESILLFKTQGVWDKYRIYIICLFLFLFIETLLVFILIMSIRKRKIAESKIAKQQILLDMTGQLAHIGGWEFDVKTLGLRWTEEVYRIHELEESYIPSIDNAIDFYTAGYKIKIQDAIENALECGESFDLEVQIKTGKGNLRWVHSIGYAKTINGVVTTISGTIQDITKRKQVEKESKAHKDLLRTVLDIIPAFICAKNLDGRFILTNKKLTDFYGTTVDKMTGMLHADLCEDEEELKAMLSADQQVIENGIPKLIPEETMENSDGSITVLETYKIPFTANDEAAVLIASTDITERKQAQMMRKKLEKQLLQAQKMESVGLLAGGIAHDFNNILFPIIGHAEMLLEDVPEDSPFRVSLNQIYSSALRASELVKQILTFSRQENTDFKLMKMQPIIKEALKLIRSTIPATIEIKQNIQTDCGVIKADPTQIHQIIMNLATNAYHAMEETGGELKVGLKQMELGALDLINQDMAPGVYACLTIADTGKGMDKKLTNKIFDPFFTTKEIGKGTGMGLSVVHGIVAGMGGAVRVYSEPDKGAEFQVYLPVKKSAFEKQSPKTNEPLQGGTERILLVDDDEGIITMEKQALERLGYQVTSRTSSIEALDVFKANPHKFDLVITDMAMPNISGDKLSAELIKIRPDIPVLLCTGFSETMSEKKAASLGIKGFLFKPIVMQDLSQKVREVLGEN